MEDLINDVIEFATNNREALKPAEEWADGFGTDFDMAWELAKNESPRDWRKIIHLSWVAFDQWKNHQNDNLLGVILNGSYTSSKHPNYYVIKAAIDEGIKELSGENAPSDLIDLKKAIEVFETSKTTLKRRIKAGGLKTYQKNPQGKHYISVKEAKFQFNLWPKYLK